uniref:Sirtuin 3 n=1 Tax=Sparus aurata TaxID=8175 RepID=A0A671WZ64_SPAAU
MLFGLSCIAESSQLCFAAKLQKCFVDCDTSPDFISAFERWLSQFHKTSKGDQLSKDILLRLERQFKRVVVMAGAGISTPSGIPDFRSPGSGLYDNLQQYDLPYAEAIFEIGFFRHNPNPFFALAKELYPGNYQPNLTHYFVRLLHEKKQLLRMYTQNIDGLERLAGIPPEMLVEAHGTFATATCTVCRKNYKGEDGTVPKCPTCTGVVKPDIVFFGEELPRHFFKYLTDFPLADLLIVMGTSLEVSASDFIMSLKHETMCEDLIFKVNVFNFILICIYSQKVVLYNVDI